MSSVTDLVLIIPASAWRGHADQIDLCVPERAVAVRFADLFESFPRSPDFSPVPVQDNGTKNSGATVFHLGVNHMATGFVEALRAEPWPPGTVLYLQHEDDDEPAVTVWTRQGVQECGEASHA